jgi:hypothetical protein
MSFFGKDIKKMWKNENLTSNHIHMEDEKHG